MTLWDLESNVSLLPRGFVGTLGFIVSYVSHTRLVTLNNSERSKKIIGIADVQDIRSFYYAKYLVMKLVSEEG